MVTLGLKPAAVNLNPKFSLMHFRNILEANWETQICFISRES